MGLIKEIARTALEYLQRDGSDKHDITFSSSDPPNVWKPLLGFDLVDTPQSANQYKSFAYACINKKASTLANAEIGLYREFKSKKTAITDHPFLSLIHSQNSFGQTFRQALFLASINCDLYGWAFIYIVTVDFLGQKMPVEFIPIPARSILPKYNINGTGIDGFIVTTSYGEGVPASTFIPNENMLVFKIPNPHSNLIPLPPVRAFNFTMDIDYAMSKSQYAQFLNESTPSLIIEMPNQMNADTAADYRERFADAHAGSMNRRKPMVIDSGAKVQKVGMSPQEMDFVTSRKQILDEIMLILDVSKQVMNMFEDSNFNNGANALMAWIRFTIEPYANMVFNEQLTAIVKRFYDKKLITSMSYAVANDELELKELELLATYAAIEKDEMRDARDWPAMKKGGSELAIKTSRTDRINDNVVGDPSQIPN